MWFKNKLLVTVVPFLTTFLFVGSGFGVWVFYSSEAGDLSQEVGIPINISSKANLGHFAKDHDNQDFPTFMLFEEGNSSTDLNEGLEFYKSVYSDITKQNELVKNDEIKVIFHREVNDFTLPSDIRFVLGAKISILTDTSINPNAVPLSKYVTISSNLYANNNFVNLLDYYPYTVSKEDFDKGTGYEGLKIQEYVITINLGDIFAYASEAVKPNTLTKYTTLYNDFINYSEYWKINIEFSARFEGTNG